ncbi:MAG: DUF4123 domain-containing protein [Rubrivivax sp.]
MPTTPEQRAQIKQVLWPESSPTSRSGVWAVLDCARDPQIYPALQESRLEFRCLYSGALPRELERVAPQLVELLPDHRLTQRLIDAGWGRAWGVFVKIDDPSNLRHHLRRFLEVQDEEGRRLVFRYYDPRVLRAYLPSCTPEELDTLFGPLDAYLAEGADGDALIEFSRRGAQLVQRRHVLTAVT